MAYIGIDFGTTNSSVAIYNKSNIIVAPNKIGERTTPSLVAFPKNFKKVYVGEDVLDQKLEDTTLIYDVKRFIGLDYNEFQRKQFSKYLNYPVINDGGIPKIKVNFNGEEKLYTVEEISSLIIKKIVYNAEQYLENSCNIDTSIKKAVITVPVHFSKNQINAINKAFSDAGIEIMRVINEPTAAALAYGIGNDLIPNTEFNNQDCISSVLSNSISAPPSVKEESQKIEEKVMIFDLGGGTFDITLLNIKKIDENILNFDIEATNGISNFGGSDFDNKLVDYCVKVFCKRAEKEEDFVRNNLKAFKRLKVKCENAKKLLNISNESVINMDNFDYKEDIAIKITQSKFEDICSDLFYQIKKTLKELFSDSPIKPKDIDSIILIGGATRMPGIKKILKNIFGDENKIKDSINPEEAVAIGAALEAAKIGEKNKINFILQDIIPYNLGISSANQDINEINKGEKMFIMIKKYTKIPWETKEKSFKVNLTKESPNFVVNIYEGNNPFVSENSKLDTIIINDINKIGEIEFKIKFNVDVNSKLIVTLKVDSPEIIKIKEIEKSVTHGIADFKKKKITIFKSVEKNTIKSIIENINSYESKINSSTGIKKLENLKDCSKEQENLIEYYLQFSNNNDFVFEKIFLDTKELFEKYIELLNSKEIIEFNIEEIINKIKSFMKNLISFSGYISSLFDLFSKLEKNCINEFYKIFKNYLDLMIEEGDNREKEIKFRRYYSKLYFENAFFACKKYMNSYEFNAIERELSTQIKKLNEIIENKLKQINSFAIVIDYLAKEEKFLFGSTGYTKKIMEIQKLRCPDKLKEEELEDLSDLFQNMANTYNFKERKIGQAYCLANIIIINYKILKSTNLLKLNGYLEKLEIIMSEREDEKYEWYEEIKEFIREIKIKE